MSEPSNPYAERNLGAGASAAGWSPTSTPTTGGSVDVVLMPTRAERAAEAGRLLLVTGMGALAAAVGSFLQAVKMLPYGLPEMPWGVVVALVLSALVFLASGWWLLSRRGALAAALGWLVVVLLFSIRRDEGDLVLAESMGSSIWLVGGAALAGLSTVPRYHPRRHGLDHEDFPDGERPPGPMAGG